MCGDVTHLLLRAHAAPTKSIVEEEDEVEETQQQQLHQFRIENLHTHTFDASRWSFIVFFFWGAGGEHMFMFSNRDCNTHTNTVRDNVEKSISTHISFTAPTRGLYIGV